MTMKQKNDKIADELREMSTAMGFDGASALLTRLRAAYRNGESVLIMFGDASSACTGSYAIPLRQPAPDQPAPADTRRIVDVMERAG